MGSEPVALVLGTFDVLHWGHVLFLNEAARYGEVTVGVSSDELVLQQKGARPLFTLTERQAALETLGYKTIARTTGDARTVFDQVKPSLFVCGNDWLARPDESHLESAGLTVPFLNQSGVTLVYVPREHKMSSSEIIKRARK